MKTININSNRLLIFYNNIVLLLLLNFNFLNGQSSDIDIIRDRVYHSTLLNYSGLSSMESGFDNEAIKKILSDFDGDKWPYIHYEDVSREGFDNTIHLNNLLRLAVAYKSSASNYFYDKNILKTIIRGLRFWCDNDFIGENWWNNQIGTPYMLVRIMLVVGDELPEKLILKSQKIIGRADINKVVQDREVIESKSLRLQPKINFF